jgi:hypothetical protein
MWENWDKAVSSVLAEERVPEYRFEKGALD